MYYIEKLLVMICINNGSGGMVIRLEIETWLIGKGGTKSGCKKERVVGGRGIGAAGFCSPYMCWGLFLLL
jgi:hypothetical protein